MESWVGALPGIIASLIVLIFLTRSLLNMYDRLWKENSKKQANPEELAYMIADAVNEALKRERDRERKRVARPAKNDDELKEAIGDHMEKQTGLPPARDEIDEAFDQYKRLTGQDLEVPDA